MVTKYQMISYLAEDTAKEIAKNGQEWTRYLTTAARLYKYPFNEQILIFAQRPDATACASLELWNEKMNCWVNRGAKGIAREKVMMNIEKYGNTSAASIPLCLSEWESKLKKGDNLVLTAFGAGFTWGAVYLKWAYDTK